MAPLPAALLALIFAQILKVFNSFPPRFSRIIGSGGMPSSHSAFVTCLTTVIALRHGLNSDIFAITAVFALITIDDAGGVRRAVGKQANVLNRLIRELDLSRLEENKELIKEELKELIGHTPFEILAGILLGLAIGLLSAYVV